MNQVLQNIVNYLNNNTWVLLVPTLLFALIITLAFLIGMKRGAVKSFHKFMIMGICLASAIGVFYLLIQNNGEMLYTCATQVMSWFNVSWSNLIQVEPVEPNMYGVIYPVVAKLVAEQLGGPENMAIEVYAQIDVLTQMGYKFITFLLCGVLFTLLSIVLNMFDWLLFRKSKRVRKFKRSHPGKKYKNHSLTGGVIGSLHGLVTTMILFSFIGFTFYAIGSGGRNDDKLSFKDESMSNIYEITNFTDKLGDTGVLKFLNDFKDDNNVPFYLFFANEIFSGKATNYNGEEYTVYASKEFRSYTKLARDLMDVLAKHGGQDISLDILTNKNPDQTYDTLKNLFSNKAFTDDLMLVIDKYEPTEYLKNITKSSISMVGKYYNEIFTKFSPNNPLPISIFDAILGDKNDPYFIAVEDIVSFSDARLLLKGVLNSVPKILEITDFMKDNQSLQVSQPKLYTLNLVNYSLEAVEEIMPTITNLSIFKPNAKDTRAVEISKIEKMNKVYDRCIDFAFSFYKDANGNSVANPFKGHNIEWNQEFINLTTSISDVTSLTNELLKVQDETKLPALEVFNTMFSKDYANRAVVDRAYYGLAEKASKFDSVQILLDSDMFYSLYEGFLTQMCGTNVVLPHNIVWADQGEVKGELTKTITIARELLAEEVLKPYLKDPSLSDLNTIKDILLKLDSPYYDKSLLEFMFESDVLYYTSSALLSNIKTPSFEIIVPNSSKTLIEGIEVTKKDELINTVRVLPLILGEIKDLNAIKQDPLALVDVISKPEIKNSVINSNIISATMSQTIYNLTTTNPQMGDVLVIPAHLKLDGTNPHTIETWLYANGELDKLLTTLPVIDIKALTSKDNKAIVDLVKSIPVNFDTLMGSDIVYFTVCNLVTTLQTNNFTLFVPEETLEVFNTEQVLLSTTGNVEKVIKKSELLAMFNGVSKIIGLDPQTNNLSFDFNAIVEYKTDILASNILYASVSNKLIELSNTQTNKFIYIPTTFVTANLHKVSESVWRTNNELEALLESFKVLNLDINSLISGGFDTAKLTSQMLSLDELYNNTNKTKIETLYESAILALTLSETIKNEPSISNKLFVPTTSLETMTVSSEQVIKASEWVNLISGVKKAFGLTSQSDIMAEFADFTGLINKFFTSSDYKANKFALFNSLILEHTIVNNIVTELDKPTNNAVIVPAILSANNNQMWYLDRTTPTYKDGELSNMLDILYVTGAGKAFGQANFAESLNNSLQLQNLLYTKNDSLLPNSSDLLAHKQTLQNELLQSHILRATLIDKLTSLNVMTIPAEYKLTDIKNTYTVNNIWNESQELNNMFNSINELKLDIVDNNINMDVNTMLNTTYDMLSICKSKVIHLTLSDKLINTPNLYFASTDVLTNSTDKYVSANELNNLFGSIKVLTNGGSFDINNIKISVLFNENYEDNMAKLFASNTLQLTIMNMLNDTFSSSTSFVLPSELTFTNKLDKIVDLNDKVVSRYIYNTTNNTIGYNEIKHIFDIINVLGLAPQIDNNAGQINLDLNLFVRNSNNSPAQNDVVIDRQNKIFNSLLFSTTFVKYINEIGLELPSVLTTDYKNIINKTSGYLESNWYKHSEVMKLIRSIEALNIQIVNNSIALDIDKYLTLLNDKSIDLCYNSSVMYYTLSNTLIKNTTNTLLINAKDYSVDTRHYGEKVLSVVEFKNLIAGIKALGLTSLQAQVVVPTIESVDTICMSNTLKATISNKVLTTLNKRIYIDDLTTKFELIKKLDNTVNGYGPSVLDYVILDNTEIKAFVTVLNGNNSGSNTDFNFKINSIQDVMNLNDNVFESKLAVSIINEFILGDPLITKGFVATMNTKVPGYQIKSVDVLEISINSIVKLNKQFISKQDLLIYKNGQSLMPQI